jgi:hypothetical protein
VRYATIRVENKLLSFSPFKDEGERGAKEEEDEVLGASIFGKYGRLLLWISCGILLILGVSCALKIALRRPKTEFQVTQQNYSINLEESKHSFSEK